MKLQAARAETYAELAERVAASRTAEGIVDAHSESTRERLWILPEIGHLPLAEVTPEHIAGVYDTVRAAGRSQSSLRHVRAILRSRFEVAMSCGLASNPLDRVRVPKVKIDRRERAVLTDDELVRYLGWQHPQEHHRLAVLERQTMSALARMFGGLRTGDLHSMTWEHFDAKDSGFTWGMALRRKTARPQRIEVPAMLRPILVDWWQRQGKPTRGLLFPALRGKRAGEGTKTGVSHAEGLRRDLARCFGVEAFDRKTAKWERVKDRKLTNRERELLEETEFTRPVEFHSWRRRFVQALADMGMSAQQAQKLAGHADLSAHERYLRTTSKTLVIPVGALPAIEAKVPSVPKTSGEHLSSCAA
jgi:integrase